MTKLSYVKADTLHCANFENDPDEHYSLKKIWPGKRLEQP